MEVLEYEGKGDGKEEEIEGRKVKRGDVVVLGDARCGLLRGKPWNGGSRRETEGGGRRREGKRAEQHVARVVVCVEEDRKL